MVDTVDFRQLRYISVLAEERHFGRAAKRLDMSQPSLSTAIKQIESEFGNQLFTRDSRNVEITRAGSALQNQARLLLRQYDETKALLKAVVEGKQGRLHVGFGGSMLLKGLPQIVDRFRKKNVGIDLVLTEMSSAEQMAALKRDEIDLGFVLGAGMGAHMDGFRFCSERLVVCLPLRHPLAKAKTFKLERLMNDEFVSVSRSAAPYYFEAVASICRSHGFSCNVRYEVGHMASVISFVASGMGVALVPETSSKRPVSGAKFIAIPDPHAPVETWCVWREIDQRPGLKAMLEVCQSHAQKKI
jgi:DNA-binding transcriptional LysR family regulator